MAKANKRKPKKPTGAVAMAASEQHCGHAFCEPGECKAGTRPPLAEEDLPRRARRALADRARALDALRRLDVHRLADLERRAGVVVGRPEQGPGEELHDGFPSSLRRSPGGRGRAARLCSAEVLVAGQPVRCGEEALSGRRGCEAHSSDEDEDPGQLPPPPQSDPTGELAAAGLLGVHDGAPDAVRRVYRELDAAVGRLLSSLALVDVLLRNPLAGRTPSVGSCRACGVMVTGVGSDRFRGGYCPACAEAFRRRCQEGPVDRAEFERERRERRQGAA